MSKQKEFKFHVIEVLDPPYMDPEKYVCVLNSWIRLCDVDGVALVRLPLEELSEIKKRVEKQDYSENWTMFLANVKYSTNSYEEASNCVKILNQIPAQEQSSTKIVEDVPSTSDRKVLESQSSSETNKVCKTSTLNRDAEPVSKEIRKHLDLTNTEVKGLPDQTTKEKLLKTSHFVEESYKTNNKQENKPSAKNPSELTRKLQIIIALRLVFGDNYKETLEKLNKEFEKTQLSLEKMQLAFKSNCEILKKFIELLNEINNGPDISHLDHSAIKELENSMMEVNINKNNSDKATGSKVQNDSQKKEEMKHNSESTEVKNNNPLKKIRGQARKFTLPPEYDPNDSRWTLKHREKKSGLVELLPKSRVFIDAIQLSHSKITSKDSKTLARMLLLEIFTENALSICSLTGKKANAFDFAGTSVRPGLDEHARTVLLKFVKKHAAERNWPELDPQLIVNTIRNKMHEIRNKRQHVVEK